MSKLILKSLRLNENTYNEIDIYVNNKIGANYNSKFKSTNSFINYLLVKAWYEYKNTIEYMSTEK